MSPQVPYSPMHAPAKHVSHDRMQEILSKRSGATQSPKAKEAQPPWPSAPKDHAPEPPPPRSRGQLQWQKPEAGSTGVRTVCEWYSCAKTKQGDEWHYEVWTREPLTGGMKMLAAGLLSFEAGRKVAQDDADAKSSAEEDSAK
jgi:hypothetical protein